MRTGLPVADGNGVVMPIQPMNQCLDGWLVQVAKVGGRLARLLSEHHGLRIDEPAQLRLSIPP